MANIKMLKKDYVLYGNKRIIKIMKTLLLSAALAMFGCVPDIGTSEENLPEVTSDTSKPQQGIVSENPPGIDDWHKDSGDTNDKEDMVLSYEGCSNEVELWTEPDPLKHPCNFRLKDQNGNHVELYDFQGDVILLDFSTVWCTVCKTVASHAQELHDRYDPFSLITILTEDNNGDVPDVSVLKDWADSFGITTSPVLSGEGVVGEDSTKWDVNGMPCFFVIDKNFYLRKIQPGWNEEDMTEYIEQLILE